VEKIEAEEALSEWIARSPYRFKDEDGRLLGSLEVVETGDYL